jgi:transposase
LQMKNISMHKVFVNYYDYLPIKNGGLPITLVLDNAKYQKCSLVRELTESLKINLLYLPAYYLNLIERLWKFVKKKCLYSKYYKHFGSSKKQ